MLSICLSDSPTGSISQVEPISYWFQPYSKNKPMNILVRDAKDTDFEQLVALFAEENRFHAELVPDYIQVTDDILTRDELHEFITDEDSHIFVCETESQVVGAVIVSIHKKSEDRWKKSFETAYIDDLIVSARARRKGVGKRLMKRAIAWARTKGFESIELHVWQSNPGAIRLYESLGFTIIQHRMKCQISQHYS
jgi:ribosomal protein S18 acetylase RimI-like enzyme